MPCGFRLPAPGSAGVPAASPGRRLRAAGRAPGWRRSRSGRRPPRFPRHCGNATDSFPRQPPDDPHSPADLPVARVLAEIGIEVGQVGALGEAFKFGRQATPEGLDHRALEIVHQPSVITTSGRSRSSPANSAARLRSPSSARISTAATACSGPSHPCSRSNAALRAAIGGRSASR